MRIFRSFSLFLLLPSSTPRAESDKDFCGFFFFNEYLGIIQIKGNTSAMGCGVLNEKRMALSAGNVQQMGFLLQQKALTVGI